MPPEKTPPPSPTNGYVTWRYFIPIVIAGVISVGGAYAVGYTYERPGVAKDLQRHDEELRALRDDLSHLKEQNATQLTYLKLIMSDRGITQPADQETEDTTP